MKQTGNIRKGRGIAMGGFASSQAANVADIEVNVKTGKIVAKHMYVAVVAGLMAAPAQAENNMSGALIMGASRALTEEVTFDKGRVTSLDWVSYPLLRFKDSPYVTTVVVQRTDLQATGNGEPPTAAAAASIANCVLRRHGCSHDRSTDDAGARSRNAEGRRLHGLSMTWSGSGPGFGPPF